MIEVLRPAFLWTGGLLAAGAVAIHLLRPRERTRKPLPTARFLTPDPRRRIRLHTRPDELPLLVVRMALGLCLGAAFAGIHWVGPGGGTTTVVVIDASGSAAASWDSAGALARDVEGPVALALVRPGSDAGAPPRLQRLGGAVPAAAAWRELAPSGGDGELRLAHLVRAVRDVGASLTGADSVRARIVMSPRWEAWSPGAVELRRALWPGRMELADPGAPVEGAHARDLGDAVVAVRAPEPLASALAGALETLGVPLDGPAAGDPDGGSAANGPMRIELRAGPPDTLGDLWNDGAPPAPDTGGRPAAFLLLDGRVLAAAGPPPGGTPAPGAMVPLLRVGGRPAAAARTGERTCTLALPTAAENPVSEAGDLVVLVESLLREGCGVLGRAGATEAFRAVLEERDGPPSVAVEALPGRGAGVPLARGLLALALALAALDVALGRRAEARYGTYGSQERAQDATNHRDT